MTQAAIVRILTFITILLLFLATSYGTTFNAWILTERCVLGGYHFAIKANFSSWQSN
jgi:hypothetical protein